MLYQHAAELLFSAALTHNAESSHCSACVALFGVAHAYPPWLTSVFLTLLVEMGNPRQWHFCMPKGLQVVLSKTMSTSRMSVCVCVCMCVCVCARMCVCAQCVSVCVFVCVSICVRTCISTHNLLWLTSIPCSKPSSVLAAWEVA